MAGALRGGALGSAGGGKWHWAHVPVRAARSLAGVCWRRGPLSPQAHAVGQLVPRGLEARVLSAPQRRPGSGG
eukprot:9124057-Alexandrium_andersonii.AAC.1